MLILSRTIRWQRVALLDIRSMACWAVAGSLLLHCRQDSDALHLVEVPQAQRANEQGVTPAQFPLSESAFGLPVPEGMRVTSHYVHSAEIVGRVPHDQVVAHVRDHVLATVAEVTPRRTVFPRVYLKGDPSQLLYRIEVSKETQQRSKIWISNVTPPPSPEGLSEEERWKRAGRKPDGTLLDPNSTF